MMGPEDNRRLAATYVLGTLDGAERALARARLAQDPDFAALVRLWEERLAPLHALSPAVRPPADLWDDICAALPSPEPEAVTDHGADEETAAPGANGTGEAPSAASPPPGGDAPPVSGDHPEEASPSAEAAPATSSAREAAGGTTDAAPSPETSPVDRTGDAPSPSALGAVPADEASPFSADTQRQAPGTTPAVLIPIPDAVAQGPAEGTDGRMTDAPGSAPGDGAVSPMDQGGEGDSAGWALPIAPAPEVSSAVTLPQEAPHQAGAAEGGLAEEGLAEAGRVAEELAQPARAQDVAAPVVQEPTSPEPLSQEPTAQDPPQQPHAPKPPAQEGGAEVAVAQARPDPEGHVREIPAPGAPVSEERPAPGPPAEGPTVHAGAAPTHAADGGVPPGLPPDPGGDAAPPPRPRGPFDIVLERPAPTGADGSAPALSEAQRDGGNPWRLTTGLLLVAGLIGGGAVAYREMHRQPPPPDVFAPLKSSADPLMVLALDPEAGDVVVRHVEAPPPPGMVYRMWLISHEHGTRALCSFTQAGRCPSGVLGTVGRAGVLASMLQVTLEPVAFTFGTPTGKVVFYGRALTR